MDELIKTEPTEAQRNQQARLIVALAITLAMNTEEH